MGLPSQPGSRAPDAAPAAVPAGAALFPVSRSTTAGETVVEEDGDSGADPDSGTAAATFGTDGR